MLPSDIPDKFPVAFASSAGGGFVRPIPEASQIGIVNGAASLVTGFPPLNFSPVSAGGVPPFGQDMNGILRQITEWSRWFSAGAPVAFDSAFATAIGGYPSGAILASASTVGVLWLSVVDNNMVNPDGGLSADWLPLTPGKPARIITATGAISPAIDAVTDESIGFFRSGSGASTGTLPASTPGKEFWIEDLKNDFSVNNVTITAPGGQSFGTGLNTFVCDENAQSVRFKYYGSNLWGVKR